jgi:hypothetical protein
MIHETTRTNWSILAFLPSAAVDVLHTKPNNLAPAKANIYRARLLNIVTTILKGKRGF